MDMYGEQTKCDSMAGTPSGHGAAFGTGQLGATRAK